MRLRTKWQTGKNFARLEIRCDKKRLRCRRAVRIMAATSLASSCRVVIQHQDHSKKRYVRPFFL